MADRKVTVLIYLPGETAATPAGIFTHDIEMGIGSFAYGRRYLERPNALPVDPIAPRHLISASFSAAWCLIFSCAIPTITHAITDF